jgi:hypothetical protein
MPRPIEPFAFSTPALETLADAHREAYAGAVPYPHVVLDDFLPAAYADTLLDVFPSPDSPIWLDWRKRDLEHHPRKQGIGHASRLEGVSPWLHNIIQAFNAYPFLNFLTRLTGIEKLLPDPYLHGGGVHQILPGGRLSVHTDFNDLASLDLYRRINVLLYLNKDWQPGFGGELELWDADMRACVRSVPPVFNRLVVFNTNKRSFHGHPAPLQAPEGMTRKSLALYYYTAQPAPEDQYDGQTDWREPAIP